MDHLVQLDARAVQFDCVPRPEAHDSCLMPLQAIPALTVRYTGYTSRFIMKVNLIVRMNFIISIHMRIDEATVRLTFIMNLIV